MILLNKPWSHYERQIERARRHEASRRFLGFVAWSFFCIALGLAFAALLH